jgi:MFS family permease
MPTSSVGSKTRCARLPMKADAKSLRLLVLIQLIAMGAMEISGPFWPLQIQRLLGAEKAHYIGFLSTMVYVGPLLAAAILTPLWGKLGDRTGHKPMIVRALVALALCQGFAGLATDPWVLVAVRVLQGALAGFIAAAQAYALTSFSDTGRGKILVRLQTATAVGSLTGPVLGGWLIDRWGFASLCFSATAICLLCAVLSLFLPGDAARTRHAENQTTAALPRGWLKGILLIIVLIQAAKVMPQPFYALYVSEILHAPGWLIGVSYAASAATLALSAPYWGRLIDSWQPSHTLQVIERVAWLCALTLACTALANEWVGFLATRLLWGVWQGALLPVAYTLIACSTAPGKQGFNLGIANSAAKAGALCGLASGGIGVAVVGLANSFWLVALTYTLAALGIRWVRSLSQPPHTAPAACAFLNPDKRFHI